MLLLKSKHVVEASGSFSSPKLLLTGSVCLKKYQIRMHWLIQPSQATVLLSRTMSHVPCQTLGKVLLCDMLPWEKYMPVAIWCTWMMSLMQEAVVWYQRRSNKPSMKAEPVWGCKLERLFQPVLQWGVPISEAANWPLVLPEMGQSLMSDPGYQVAWVLIPSASEGAGCQYSLLPRVLDCWKLKNCSRVYDETFVLRCCAWFQEVLLDEEPVCFT